MLGRDKQIDLRGTLIWICAITQAVNGRSWLSFRPIIATFMTEKPILAVLFEFEHALDFHKF